MKTLLVLSAIFLSAITMGQGQTYVSGNISVNTIWTGAGSPYVITDTVVVTPNTILTIEPGVVVKFMDNKRLEIHAGTINAIGTATDSIEFTSHSAQPNPGIWGEIFMNGQGGPVNAIFSHCKFNFANNGILCDNYNSGLEFKNSSFISNNTGLNGGQWLIIDSCEFIGNTDAINITSGSLSFCNIFQNLNGISSSYIDISNSQIHANVNGIKNCNIDTMVHCRIESNQTGISSTGISGTCFIDSSLIRLNQTGISITSNWYNTIRNSIIDSNAVAGIVFNSVTNSSVINCQIRNNETGIIENGVNDQNHFTRNIIENNSIGIISGTGSYHFHCNKICNNSTYDLKYTGAIHADISDNYWCSSDSLTIAGLIFDGNDSAGLGIAGFMPFDTVQCFQCPFIEIHFVVTKPSCSTCSDGTATAYPKTGSPPYSYLWNTSPVQTTQTATGLPNGYHTVCVTDSFGCSDCDSVYLDYSFQIDEAKAGLPYSIFPNPFSTQTTIQLKEIIKEGTLTVYNRIGQQVRQINNITGNSFILQRDQLPGGLYFLYLTQGGRTIFSARIIITEN